MGILHEYRMQDRKTPQKTLLHDKIRRQITKVIRNLFFRTTLIFQRVRGYGRRDGHRSGFVYIHEGDGTLGSSGLTRKNNGRSRWAGTLSMILCSILGLESFFRLEVEQVVN